MMVVLHVKFQLASQFPSLDLAKRIIQQ